ncbi:MAG TPA: AraC family transcriptional regulator [Gemmatimonadaceae bacterium]
MRREFSPILLVGHETEPPGWLTRGAPVGTPVFCATDLAAARNVLERGDVHIVICEPRVKSGDPTRQLLEDIACDFPSVASISVASRLRVDPEELLRVARTGVHALLFEEDRRTPLSVRRVLTEAATRCRNAHVWGDIAPMTPDRVRPLVAYGLKHSHQALTVDGVARALGLHRKTLAERCALAGTLPPQQMLGWCRLLAAAVLLEDRGRLVDHIALELDFPSGGAFRNMLKRYTGLSPAELRAKGTITEMSRQFGRAVAPAGWSHAAIRAS